MRNLWVWTMILFMPLVSGAESLDFVLPEFEHPYYRLVFPFEVEADNTGIVSVSINGRQWAHFFVFQKAKFIDASKPLAKGSYRIHCDYAWKGGRTYEILLAFDPGGTGDCENMTITGTAPEGLGIPMGEEGLYRVFRLYEPVGLDRKGEVCTMAFTAAKNDFGDGDFVLLQDGKSLDFQILDIRENIPPENVAANHPETLTYKLAFPVRLARRGRAMLLLVKSDKKPAAGHGFQIDPGPNAVGKTVRSRRIALEFHPQSGQINTIVDLQEQIKLYNEAGVIHWNPGVFIPGIAWDHSFNWKEPPSYAELQGPYVYINTRRGPLQKIRDVNLEVKYTMLQGAPYFLSETMMRVNKDLGVLAIRNDEMVLYKELFDSFIYKGGSDRIVKGELKEMPGFPDGFVHRAPDDLEWVGLLNTRQNFGFFSIRVAYANSNLNAAGSWLNKPGTYFYAPSDGKYVYWVRPLLYTWAEYTTRNLFTFVEEGSFFYEKNAYLVLPLTEGYMQELDELRTRLLHPVRID
jgi:hypothetical protein